MTNGFRADLALAVVKAADDLRATCGYAENSDVSVLRMNPREWNALMDALSAFHLGQPTRIEFEDGDVEAVVEYAITPSGKIVAIGARGDSYWFDADGRNPKSRLICWHPSWSRRS